MARFTLTCRGRHVLVAVVVLVVGVILGAGLRGMSGPPESRGPARPVPGSDADPPADEETYAGGPGPSSSVAGVGIGFERSEAGAVAAAMSYATASQAWLYLSDEDLAAAVEAVVVPEAREALVPPLVEDIVLLRDELATASGTVWFVAAPLATHVEVYSDDRAVVGVWTVRVLAADGVAVPQSGWQTLTFDLRWDGDWLVADVTETDGPTPQLEAGLEPWSAGYFDETLAGYVRVGVL